MHIPVHIVVEKCFDDKCVCGVGIMLDSLIIIIIIKTSVRMKYAISILIYEAHNLYDTSFKEISMIFL